MPGLASDVLAALQEADRFARSLQAGTPAHTDAIHEGDSLREIHVVPAEAQPSPSVTDDAQHASKRAASKLVRESP